MIILQGGFGECLEKASFAKTCDDKIIRYRLHTWINRKRCSEGKE